MPRLHVAKRIGLWAAALSALGLVTLSYFDPHLMRDLATRLWTCF